MILLERGDARVEVLEQPICVKNMFSSCKPKPTSVLDAFWFEVEATSCLMGIWVVLLVAMLGWLPVWVLVATPLLFIRFELASHELMHSRVGRKVGPIIRQMMVAQSVVSLGYDAYRERHLSHHRFMGTAEDPESYLIQGSSWRSLFKAMFAVEVVLYQWARVHRLDLRFWAGALVRAGVFALLLVWNPEVFLVYLLFFRVIMGLAEFFFHHCLHGENHVLLRGLKWLAAWFPWLVKLLVGSGKVAILLHHDDHHAHPWVSARHLAALHAATHPSTSNSTAGLPNRSWA